EVILIARDWQKEVGGGESRAGYLGSGLSKFAFKGRLGPNNCAILQSKSFVADTGANQNDLLDELALLSLGQWFLDSFYKLSIIYIKAHNSFLAMKWNTTDTFVGTVVTAVTPIAGRPAAGEKDNRTLLFPDFLVTPLLPSGSQYREVKFSGNEDFGNNTDPVGEAVDAYAHHTVADSFGDVLFADLQGKPMPSFETGYWDKGPGMIQAFLRQHQCNHICKKMKLPQATKDLKVELLGQSTSAPTA
ncbi:hypothetical protein FIBSPDRAFT_763888, partial [Athelia psychrophila]